MAETSKSLSNQVTPRSKSGYSSPVQGQVVEVWFQFHVRLINKVSVARERKANRCKAPFLEIRLRHLALILRKPFREKEEIYKKLPESEIKKLNDPNFLVELAIGPPNPSLVPQKPGSGLTLGGQFAYGPRQFVFKKAHFSFDDSGIYAENGEIVLVSHHLGKNPLDSLDPLGLANTDQYVAPFGEWDSICNGTGYHGMPNFKVRPAHISIHGKQYVQDPDGNVTYFNVAKMSRIKSKSIRHNLKVCRGDSNDVVYNVLLDLAGRSIQLVNKRNELEAIMTKSTKTLIMNAAFGAGSELQIDVAPGVDWTTVLAVLIAIKQVGKNLARDALSNITSSITGAATGAAVDAAGDPGTFEGITDGVDLGGVGESVGEAASAVAEGVRTYSISYGYECRSVCDLRGANLIRVISKVGEGHHRYELHVVIALVRKKCCGHGSHMLISVM
ncbi:hypothetical protein R1flu_012091 [Riccia fluitans]|uniref:Uncharacterized protein n=1 Tax=Riccia fluitans TaxID=41844 RepID=A0ABD1Z9N0_9MARC